MKFIHAADLHIESPYKGVRALNKRLGDALIQHGVKAYEQLIQQCIEHEVDFLVIAGDSFDSASGSLAAQYRFFKGLERLAQNNINVYVICGNHDPLNQWAKNYKLPENVTLFEADEVQHHTHTCKDKMTVEVYGVSYGERDESRNLAKKFKRNDAADFGLALLHGNLNGNENHANYCPFSMDDLRRSGMDYWALGHIHKREVLHEEKPCVVYSGNIQGRHFNEADEKGCYLVDVDTNKNISLQFFPLSKVVFQEKEESASNLEEVSDLFSLLEDLRSQLLQEKNATLLRVRLTGNCSIYDTLSDQQALNELIDSFNENNDYSKNFVHLDNIVNATVPTFDLNEVKQSSDFMADLLQRFDELDKHPEQASALKKELLSEIKSSSIGSYIRSVDVEASALNEIINTARWKCINGLYGKNN